MKLKFAKIVDAVNRETEMLLYGDIGNDIDGNWFARELNYLGDNYDKINIRVNSNGGLVSQGLSVVAEMLVSRAQITVTVDGIAASMAAVIIAAADNVKINDFAKLMIHSPFYVDENGTEMKSLSKKDKRGLEMIKDTLVKLLMKRGISEEDVLRMMKTDTWFTADEALEAKLVDEVVSTGRKTELASLSPLKLVAKLTMDSEESNHKKMDKIIKALNEKFGITLKGDATEQQVIDAVAKISIPKDSNKKLIDQMISIGKKTGAVTDGESGNEDKFRRLATVDMDLFIDMLHIDKAGEGKMPKGQKRMSDLLTEAAQKNKGAVADVSKIRDFAWYEKNDPSALAKMESLEPEKFAKLEAADKLIYEH